MEIGHSDHSAKFFEHEEDRTVLNQTAPIPAANQIRLFLGELRAREAGFWVAQEFGALLGLNQIMQKPVQPVTLDALRCPIPTLSA